MHDAVPTEIFERVFSENITYLKNRWLFEPEYRQFVLALLDPPPPTDVLIYKAICRLLPLPLAMSTVQEWDPPHTPEGGCPPDACSC